MEEPLQPFLLLVPGDRRVGPGRAELSDFVDGDLLEQMKPACATQGRNCFRKSTF
jgi:hypothetical protein